MRILLIIGVLSLFLQPLLFSLIGVTLSVHPAFLMLFLFLLTVYKLNVTKVELRVLSVVALIFLYSFLFAKDLFVIGYINALFLPVIVYIAMNNGVDYKTYKKIAIFIAMFFVALIIESYIERIFKFKVILIKDDLIIGTEYYDESQFRSNGLYGHPLSSAQLVLLIYSTMLAMKSISRSKKIYITFFVIVSMMCFNARTATVLTAIGFLSYYFDHFNVKKITAALLVGAGIAMLVVYGIYEFGIGTRFLEFGQDESSKTRTTVFKVFSFFDLNDFLWGPNDSSLKRTIDIIGRRGNQIIIENPIVDYLFRIGLIMTIVLVVTYFTFFSKISKGLTKHQKIILFIPITISILSNISLAGGSVTLSNLVIMILILKYDTQSNTPLLVIR